jgi:hypothetical protein
LLGKPTIKKHNRFAKPVFGATFSQRQILNYGGKKGFHVSLACGGF